MSNERGNILFRKNVPVLVAIVLGVALTTNAVVLQFHTKDYGRKQGNVTAPAVQDFTSNLIGFEEVPSITTAAKGQAYFHLSTDGNSLGYKLVVSEIQNVTQAHIHLGAKGQNGEVVAWLYPSTPPPISIPGRFDGILGESTITSTNLVGSLAGQSLSTLIDRIVAGEAYVNVHTERAPSGEIRGQIVIRDANTVIIPLTSKIMGTITATTNNNMSIQTTDRVITVIQDANTVLATGDLGPTAQLAVGGAVQVDFDPATFIASKIELEKPEDLTMYQATTSVEGTIETVSGIYVIVKNPSGEPVLVEVLSGTVLQFEDGTPASRTDLKPGAVIEAFVRTGIRWAIRVEIKR